jgi:hypothetical protein
MARYTYGKTKKYRLPSGAPRGDAPGGVSTSSNPKGNRTGDMRYGSNYSQGKPGYGNEHPVRKRRKSGDQWIG